MKDICNVLRLPYEEIKVEHIVQILEKKAKEHDALQNIYLKLKEHLTSLQRLMRTISCCLKNLWI